MAVKKPLVYDGAGGVQQLQSGDSLAGPVAELDLQALTNADAGATAIGDVMYIYGSDSVKKAKADAAGTADALYFAAAVVAAAAVGSFQSGGILTGLSGLTPGATYFLSPTTAGVMTTTAPTTTGQLVVRLGKAVSATEFKIGIQPPILL